MPGLYDFSGYKPAAYLSPGVLVSERQFDYLIAQYTQAFPSAKQAYDALLSKQPLNNTSNIPKKMLSVNLAPNLTSADVSRLTNTLVAIAGEQNVFGFNVLKFT
jgi:hypothetical protein